MWLVPFGCRFAQVQLAQWASFSNSIARTRTTIHCFHISMTSCISTSLIHPSTVVQKRIYQFAMTSFCGGVVLQEFHLFFFGKLWPSGQPFVAGLQHLRKEQGRWTIFTRRPRRLDVEQSSSERRLVELKIVFVCSPRCPVWYLATLCWS